MNSSNRALPLLLLLLSVLAISASAAAGLSGAYSPIKKLNDPHVVEIAKYAVNEYNEKTGSTLAYMSVEKGASQVVAGANYKLVIKAEDGAGVGNYEAVVYERAWENYRSLTSFKKL